MRRYLLLAAALALLAVPALGADVGEAYHLKAESQEYEEDRLWRGVGDVQIAYQDITIHCDEVELNLETGDLVARGNVVLDQGPRRMSADEIHYNLRSKTGTFLNAQGEAPPFYHFSGERIEKLDETHYAMERATYSSCDQAERPPWQFRARRALLEEEGYGRFRGTSLLVKGVPVLYLPYIVWPVKKERAAGLLVPTIGYSGRRGAYLGDALFIPMGLSYDTTLYLDAYSRGYLGLGSEWRWAPSQGTTGEITGYVLRDTELDVSEWKVNGRHSQEDLLGFRFLAEVHDLSDIDFFQEFERSFDRNTLRSLYSFLYLTRSWGPYALNLRVDRRKTYLTSDERIVLNQLPEAELRVRSTRIGRSPLYWSLVSSVNYFDVDRGETLEDRYGRADLYPSLSYTLPGPPWLTITPRVAGRATYYTKQYGRNQDNQTVFVEEGLERSYLEGGVDIVGPSFSRVFESSSEHVERYKHLIEPRFEYSYLSDQDEDLEQLIPRFDEVDSTLARNRVRVTLANRLFARSRQTQSAREVAAFEVYQEHSFSEPLDYSSDQTQASQRGPLYGKLRLTPATSFTVDAAVAFDTLFDNMRSTSLSSTLRGSVGYGNLTWYQGYQAESGERSSSQVRAAFGLHKAGFPLRLDAHLSYDLEQSSFQQQRVLLYYEGSCWGVQVEYRDLQLGLYPSRDYRITLDFKGIGRMFEIQGGLGDMNE